MALKEPNELLEVFDKALTRIRSTDPMSSADRRQIADELSEVYNYVSAASRKPSLANALHSMSAHDAKVAKQLEMERQTLREHQAFVKDNFDKAEQYLKAIQLGGYAAFFALWSIVGANLSTIWAALTGLLMLISVTSFVIWEICKSTILTFSLKRHASIGDGKLENFLKKRVLKLTQDKSAVVLLAQSRPKVWLVTFIPAIAAVGILLCQLLIVVSIRLFV